jgi:probable DNA repair protein
MARGLEVWPTPDIVTWDELVERMFVADRQAGRLTGRWLPAGAAQLVWERIVRDDPDLDPLLSVAGVARGAYQSWRCLHDHCIPLAALDDDASTETAAFARWCRRYMDLLERQGWLDSVLAQRRVDPSSAGRALEMVGFDRLTPLQQALLGDWAEAGVQVLHAPSGNTAGRIGRIRCLDRAAEIDAAARWAAAELHERADRRLAIVVPDLGRERERVRRILERVLVPGTGVTGGPSPEAQAFELAAARPLLEQPLVTAALDVLDVFVRQPDLQALSRLLRNPFMADAVDEAPARVRLDARIRRYEGPGLALRSFERMAGERDCPELAQALAAGRDAAAKWREKELPSNCAKSIFSILASVGWPGPQLDSAEHQAEQRLRALVSELGACDEFTGPVSRAEAVALLRDMAGRVLFEPQELRAPLLVIDPETCAGMTFDAVWVCGLDAAHWPAPVAPDPFLPRSLQIRHGVPRATAELATDEARRVLDRLVAAAPEVILSIPEMDDGAPLLPSPLLDGIADAATPARWPEQRLGVVQFAARPALESLVDATLPPVTNDEARRGGARLLELQAACPFRAQMEMRLAARVLEEPGVGVDAAERGDLVHKALAGVWLELRTHAALAALDEAGRQQLVRRAVAAALDEARRTADELLRHLLDLEADWLERRVLALLAADLERAPFVVRDVEQPCMARIGPLTLEMRPDRVDQLDDGSLAVIDYKTGANAEVKAWLDERPRLPQLPAYVQALGPQQVAAVAFARVRSGNAGYAGVARDASGFPGMREPGASGALKEYRSWDELLGAWHRRLEALADEYAAGDARLAPDTRVACEYCHLDALCRIAATDAERVAEEGGDE